MLHPATDIANHKEKVSTLKSDPERIRRYKKISEEMWSACVKADMHMLKYIESEDLSSKIIEQAISGLELSSIDWKASDQAGVFESLDYQGWTPELIQLLSEKGVRTSVLIAKKLTPQFFSYEMARLFVEQDSNHCYPYLFNHPDLLSQVLSKKGTSIARYYHEHQGLSNDLILIALRCDFKHWNHGSGSDYNQRCILEFWSLLPEETRLDDYLCDGLASEGYFMLLDASKQTPERALLAATNCNFLKWINYHRTADLISPIQPFWSLVTIEKSVTSTPAALDKLLRLKKRLTILKDPDVIEDLCYKAIGHDIKNLSYVDNSFPVSSKMVELFAKSYPDEVWELPVSWVQGEHIDIAIKSSPSTIFKCDERLTSAQLEEALRIDPSLLDTDRDLHYVTARSIKVAINATVAEGISKQCPSRYNELVRNKKRNTKDIKRVIEAGYINAIESDALCVEPYISHAALHIPQAFMRWTKKYGHHMGSIHLNLDIFKKAVEKEPDLIRYIAQHARIEDVVTIASSIQISSTDPTEPLIAA